MERRLFSWRKQGCPVCRDPWVPSCQPSMNTSTHALSALWQTQLGPRSLVTVNTGGHVPPRPPRRHTSLMAQAEQVGPLSLPPVPLGGREVPPLSGGRQATPVTLMSQLVILSCLSEVGPTDDSSFSRSCSCSHSSPHPATAIYTRLQA